MNNCIANNIIVVTINGPTIIIGIFSFNGLILVKENIIAARHAQPKAIE
jgi:hypothetical protein